MPKMYDYERYFMNDLFDANIIHDKISTWQTSLYNDITKGKAWYQNNRVINGSIHDIAIRPSLNLKYGLPNDTYSLCLRFNIVPYYSEKAFFDKYKYETLVSSMDVINDTKVFSKNVYFYINGYMIHNVDFMIWKDRSIVFIRPSSDLSSDDIKSTIEDIDSDESWTIFLSTKSDYYLTTMARANLFTDNKIYLSKFANARKFNKPIKNNYWTLYATGSNTSKNLMVATSTSIEEDENGEYFEISDEFKNILRSQSNVIRCFVVNEPDCGGSGIYIDSDDKSPIFQIPFKKNPIPLRNLIVWEYDASTGRKIHPLYTSAIIKFPNIYDFSEMLTDAFLKKLYTCSEELVYDSNGNVIVFGWDWEENKNYDLYIEWIEPMTDCSNYDTYLKDYIDCYGDDYASMVIHDQIPSSIKEYNPIIDLKANSFDYFTSDFHGDYRAWLLTKIIDLLIDNPRRYDELFHKLYYSSRKYLTNSYDYERNPHIYERSTLSSNEQIKLGKDDTMFFSVPHSYLKVYDYNEDEKPVELYIGGRMIIPTFTKKYGSTLYVYFPADKISNNEDIQLDVELKANPIITNFFSFLSSFDQVDLDRFNYNRNISLSNLIFFNDDTKEYLDKKDIHINTQVYIEEIQYVGSEKVDTLITHGREAILYTNAGELVVPTDADYVILSKAEETFEIENGNSQKDTNLNNISISLNNQGSTSSNTFYRKRIGIATADFFQKRVFAIGEYNSSSDEDEDMLPGEYVLHTNAGELVVPTDSDYAIFFNNSNSGLYSWDNFKGKPEKSRFRVFKNGRRISPNNFNINCNGYGKTLTIAFPSMPDGKYVIQYIGYDEDLIYETSLAETLQNTSDGIYYLKKNGVSKNGEDYIVWVKPDGINLEKPFDTLAYKVYIDGYRIPNNKIRTLGQGNMFIIENTDHDITESSTFTLYAQRHDDDSYNYSEDKQFLDNVAIIDSKFREYLIEKYTK